MSASEQPDLSLVFALRNVEPHVVRSVRSMQAAARATGLRFETLIVDDLSEDHTVDMVRNFCAQVRLVVNPEVCGRARSLNRGVELACSPRVAIVEQCPTAPVGLLRNLLSHFEEAPDLFAAGSRVADRSARGGGDQGFERARWARSGIRAERLAASSATVSPFLRMGVAVCDRERFLALGGFEEVYRQSSWQDRDLSWRAARAGWRCMYEPDGEAEQWAPHDEARLEPGFSPAAARERDRLWFNWSNLHDRGLLARQIGGMLFAPLLGAGADGPTRGIALVAPVMAALWPVVVRRMRRRRRDAVGRSPVSERELLGMIDEGEGQ